MALLINWAVEDANPGIFKANHLKFKNGVEISKRINTGA
jgi:hypothetical protein